MRQSVVYPCFLSPCLLIQWFASCPTHRDRVPFGSLPSHAGGARWVLLHSNHSDHALLHCLVLSSSARDDCTHSQGSAGSDQAMLGDVGQVLIRASDTPTPDGERSSSHHVLPWGSPSMQTYSITLSQEHFAPSYSRAQVVVIQRY